MPLIQLGRQVLAEIIAALALGGVIMSGIGLWFMIEVLRQDALATLFLAAMNVLVTVAYSTGASLYFHPKQFISPTLVQTITIPIFAILIIDLFLRRPVFFLPNGDWTTFLALYLVELSAVSAFLLATSYYILSPAARYLVGLIGTKDDLVYSQLLVHTDFRHVLATLIDPDFQYAFGIDQQEEVRANLWLFRSDPYELGAQGVVVVCPDPENKGRTQVVLVSYELASFGIVPSTRVKTMHQIDLDTLKTKFKDYKLDDERKLGETKLLPALTVAYESALARTEPKILAIKRLPTKYKAVIVATGIMLIAIGVLGWFKVITPDGTQSGLIFTGIALVFEFIPLVTLKRGSRIL